MQKKFLILGVIPILVLIAPTAMAQLDPASGHDDGVAAARADAQSGATMSASCTAHNISNVGNEQYCLNYKLGYLAEQLALGLSH